MRIGVDIDGVLADFQGGWITRYFDWFGRSIPQDQYGEWDAFLQAFDTPEEFWAWTDAVPGFWANLEPITGALGGVYQLLRGGHELVLITSRHPKVRAQTEAWVKANWPVGKLPQLHHLPSAQKGTIDCQIYIDDAPKVLEGLGNKPCVLIFDQPWNREVKGAKNLHRVRGWGEVVRFVETMGRGGEA